jgi:hypothetical protein
MSQLHYDIIADIHGRFDKLSALMKRLGYAKNGVGFIPPAGHKALFLGDLIDPKPGHPSPGGVRATLCAVKAMCDRGDALCLMGNHEFNAICFHTKNHDGKWLRIRGKGNLLNHQGTLEDFPDHDDPASEWREVWLPWMKSLPVALDLGGLRAVHACWHPAYLPVLLAGSFHDDDFLIASADPSSPEGAAVEAVLKGIEVPLPNGHSFLVHAGFTKYHIRARWWEVPPAGVRCDEIVFPKNRDRVPAEAVDPKALEIIVPYPADAPPVFFGHYFKSADSPAHPERHNVACLDHSAATSGPLVAYRWNGEARINPEHYVTHS